MLRLIASINWMIGCLALAAAVAYPFYQQVTVEKAKAAAAAAVDRIVQGERLYNAQSNGAFVYFQSNKPEMIRSSLQITMAGLETDFLYDTYSDREHLLVVRAVSNDMAVRAGRIPPLLYTYSVTKPSELPTEGKPAQGQWARLSGKSAGLLAAFGF